MTDGSNQTMRSPEKREADHGPNASGWIPGDHDPNTDKVLVASAEDKPGVAPEVETVIISGIIVGVGSRLHLKMLLIGLEED